MEKIGRHFPYAVRICKLQVYLTNIGNIADEKNHMV